MTKEEYLNALGLYENVGNTKDDLFTKKELDQAHDLLTAMIKDAKNQLKKADKK